MALEPILRGSRYETGGIIRKGEHSSWKCCRDEEQSNPTTADFEEEPPVKTLPSANKTDTSHGADDALSWGHRDT